MIMKKTIVYIDGFNLYYGLLRFSQNKWLDVVMFAKSLLPRLAEHEIMAVKYFTARVNYDPAEPTAQMRQSVYLSALAAYHPELKIIEGYYKRFRARYPFAKEPCKSCGKVPCATVWKTEEKRSDVNIASQMFIDHIETDYDCIVLISGDTDLSAALSPYFFLSFIRGSRVRKPAALSAGLFSGSAARSARASPSSCLIPMNAPAKSFELCQPTTSTSHATFRRNVSFPM